MKKKIKSIKFAGHQRVYSTNTPLGNYVSEGHVINKNCVVDSDYQGEVHISIINTSNETVFLDEGQKIIQFLYMPVRTDIPVEVSFEDLYVKTTNRGEGGFGSTGER